MEIKNILFDLDGTLTDPKLGITRSIQDALEKLGRSVPPVDELVWCIGPPLLESFPVLLKENDPSLAKKALSLYRERFGRIGKFENEVYPDIPDVLAQLCGQGFKLFVATTKPYIFARDILEHFDLSIYFTGIYGSELNGQLCDKRELLPHILKQEALDYKTSVMIGDRKHDILGAKSCRLRSIGVTYGYGTPQELLAAGADFLAESPLELPDFLTSHATGVR